MEPELDPSRELDDDERANVWAWAATGVPQDFAGQVAAAWARERGGDARLVARRARWRTWSVAAAVTLAAALAALWFGGVIRAAAMHPPEHRAMTAEAPADLVRLRDEVRGMLVQHCAPCHDAGHAEAKDDAVSVFDFNDRAWAQRLDDRQVEGVRDRLLGKQLTAPQVARVEAFVQRELAWRG